nr:MAG TPA: ubiquinol-cytochrome-c reductase complex subunit [Caudoviricetes sp.]
MIIIKSKRRIIYEIYFPAFCKDLKDLTNKIPYFGDYYKK